MGFVVSEAEEHKLADLICEAQSNESNKTRAMREILRRYEPAARAVVTRMGPRSNDIDDLLNAARWGIVRAVRKHDGRPEGFTAYVIRYMRGEALRAVERSASDDLLVTEDETFPELSAPTDESDLTDIPLHILTDGQRTLVHSHYWEDQTYTTIARTEGVTLSAVRQRMITIHRALCTHMTADAA